MWPENNCDIIFRAYHPALDYSNFNKYVKNVVKLTRNIHENALRVCVNLLCEGHIK